MKNIRHDSDDSLRAEYRRSDFGKMLRGKHAYTQLEFAELVRLLVVCIGEDTGVQIIHHSRGNLLAGHKTGDWTYEIDDANQITLRYWLTEFNNVEEPISNPPCVTTPKERIELQTLLAEHVRALRSRVDTL